MKVRPRTDYLVVHISDRNPGTGQPFTTAAEVRQFHTQERGWEDNGYHKLIRPDGTIEQGRPEWAQGAHVKEHNHHSYAICLLAADGLFTMAQIAQLKAVLRDKMHQYGVPIANIRGHNDFPGVTKSCPQFDSADLRAIVRS